MNGLLSPLGHNLQAIMLANVVGILLAGIVIFSLLKALKYGGLSDRLLLLIATSTLFSCLFEMLAFSFDGHAFAGAEVFNSISNSLLFMVNPLAPFFWALYADYKIHSSRERLRKIGVFLAIPAFMFAALSFLNLFVDIFYTIAPGNVYTRTSFYIFAMLVPLFYFLYVMGVIFVNRRRVVKALLIPLIMFMIIPITGLLLQFFFYGISVLWLSVAVSVVIVYIYVQNDSTVTDWLTKLYNRRHLDGFLKKECTKKHQGHFVGMMMDINGFKSINDTYGHQIGDKALQVTAHLLRRAAGKECYIARYAGDEFVLLLELSTIKDIHLLIDNIHRTFEEFNTTKVQQFQLSLSIGYGIYQGEEKESSDHFISRMDKEMYRVKKEKKEKLAKLEQKNGEMQGKEK